MLHTREEALALLRRYNKEPFHILHALTLEGVMDPLYSKVEQESRALHRLYS